MGRSGSSSRRKSLKKKRKSGSKKKSWRKESKRRRHDSVSSGSGGDLSSLVRREKSSRSKSGYKIRKRKHRKLRSDHSSSSASDDCSTCSDSGSMSSIEKKHRRRKSRKAGGRPKTNMKTLRKRDSSSDSDSDEYRSRKRKKLDADHVIKKSKKSSKKRAKKYITDTSNSDSKSCSTCRSRSSSIAEDGNTQEERRIFDDNMEFPTEMECQGRWETPNYESPSRSSHEKSIDHSVGVAHDGMAIFASANSRRLRSVIVVPDQHHSETEREENSPRSIYSDEERDKTGSGDHHVETGKSIHGHASGDNSNEEIGNPITVSSAEDDTETILRKRALENFRKFKADFRSTQTCQQKNNGHAVCPPATTRTAETQHTDAIQGAPGSSDLKHLADLMSAKDNSVTADIQKSAYSEHTRKDPTSIPSVQATSDAPLEKPVDANTAKKDPTSIPSVQASSEVPLEKPVDADTGGSAATEPSQVRNTEGDKSKDGSQFEQKTMTVMRGGEMVEVSYKVYIPKKPPALARRHLRR